MNWRAALSILIITLVAACTNDSEKTPIVKAEIPVAFDHGHPILAKVLGQVSDGWLVDYDLLHKDSTGLRDYLKLCATVPRCQFDNWSKPERMAFLLNVYNASTLRLMDDHHPVESIKDIGGVRPGWNLKVVRLFGEKMSLKYLEDKLIRDQFKSPAIHFALVCGSKGCPPLRKDPYTADRLEGQFLEQAKAFLRDTKKNYVDRKAKTLFLSPVFKWFSEDFGKEDAEIIKLVAEHLPEAERKALEGGGFEIRYTEFDWSANEQSPKKLE